MKKYAYAVLIFAFIACQKTETVTTETQTETAATAVSETTAITDTTVTTATTATTDTATTASTATTGTTTPAASKKPAASKDRVAVINTTAGTIEIRFFPDVAPNHVKNFITLAEQGFYNGIKFHRVIPGFMIQGGDPNTKTGESGWGSGGSAQKLNAEFSTVKHVRGIVSAARLGGDINSASSQFFIMVDTAPSLDGQYSVFGQVVKGMDVADKIVNAPTAPGDRPLNPTAIKSITFRPASDAEKGPAPR